MKLFDSYALYLTAVTIAFSLTGTVQATSYTNTFTGIVISANNVDANFSDKIKPGDKFKLDVITKDQNVPYINLNIAGNILSYETLAPQSIYTDNGYQNYDIYDINIYNGVSSSGGSHDYFHNLDVEISGPLGSLPNDYTNVGSYDLTLPSFNSYVVVNEGVLSFNGSTINLLPQNLVITTDAVPEPATWTMLIMGFGGIGAMIRHKKSSRSVTVVEG